MADTNYPSASNSPLIEPQRNKSNKNLVIGLLAAGLLGTWGYFLWDKNKAGETQQIVQTQADTYMSQRDSIRSMYDEAEIRLDSITGANNSLQGEKTALQSSLQKEIESKKAEIRKILNDKNATKAQLDKAKTMIAELNNTISGLEAEVTRLTGENQELNVANTSLKQEKTDLETNMEVIKTEKADLETTVDIASTFSASNIQVTPVNEKKSGKEKSTTTAKKVDKLVISFDVENRIAKSGAADMYLIVTAPDGKVISTPAMGSSTLNTREDGDKAYTTKVAVEYVQGKRQNIQFPIPQTDFQTGNYKVEIYHNGLKIGEGVRSLKKGGLFS
jgi:molybdopterin converting factor small subunit